MKLTKETIKSKFRQIKEYVTEHKDVVIGIVIGSVGTALGCALAFKEREADAYKRGKKDGHCILNLMILHG